MELAAATSAQTAGADLVLVPVGSLEQHGPHLPLHTDTVIATAVAQAAADRLGAWVAPPIAFGASGEHQSFPGTSSIGADALRLVIVELVRSMRTWARRVLLVNGHGGNVRALDAAVTQLHAEGHDVAWVPCAAAAPEAAPGADSHAGRAETSLMLALRAGEVRLDHAAAGAVAPLTEIMPLLVAGGVAAVSANGVLGDPAGASATEGAELLEAMIENVAAAAGSTLAARR